MYTLYSVTYDLKQPGRDYSGLYKELKKTNKWWHYLESTWLLYTSETPIDIWKRLCDHIDKNDYILIIEVRDNMQGWLPKEAWNWLHEHAQEP